MNRQALINYANDNSLSIQETQQGLNLQDMFPVTLITGELEDTAELNSILGTADRTHAQPSANDTDASVWGFDDDWVISIRVDDPQWIHLMLYENAELYERGWQTQAAGS